MVDVTDTGPLDWRIAITDGNGRPTNEFMRRWNTQRVNNGLITPVTVATGAPGSPVPGDGSEYIDISTSPPTLYVVSGGAWLKVGVYNFTDLMDVPHAYTGAGGELVSVNPGATGLEFNTLTQVLDALGVDQGSILYRDASGWTTLGPGTAGQALTTGGTGADPAWGSAGSALEIQSNGTTLTTGATLINFTTNMTATVSGTQVTVSSTGGGGGGGGTPPTLRGSSLTAAGTSSVTLAWPSGTIAGDVAVIMCGSAFQLVAPTGWITLMNVPEANWGSAVIGKVLTSGDISTGSVTVTFTGSFGEVISLCTYQGSTCTGVFGINYIQSASGIASSIVATPLYVDGCAMLTLASNRAGNVVAITPGTQLHVVQDNTDSSSGALNTIDPTAAPFDNVSAATYSTVGGGYSHIVAVVVGIAGGGGGGGGAGTVTQLNAGTGITLSPSPITTIGTISLTAPYPRGAVLPMVIGGIPIAFMTDPSGQTIGVPI